MLSRREFIITLSGYSGVILTGTVAACHGSDTPLYLGRSSDEWREQLFIDGVVGTHSVEALSAFGYRAVVAAVERSVRESTAKSLSRLKKLMRLAFARNPLVVDRLLALASRDERYQVECYPLLTEFVGQYDAVAQAFESRAREADIFTAQLLIEPLMDAGRPISLAVARQLIDELVDWAGMIPDQNEQGLRSEVISERSFLMRVALSCDGQISERIELFDRVVALERLDDDTATLFVRHLLGLGEEGVSRLAVYAASTLRNASEEACALLAGIPDRALHLVRRMIRSVSPADRTAAFRTLCKCVAVSRDLLLAAESALNDLDAGVRVWAAATLIRHYGSHPDAEVVLGWAVRRPENALRRWTMEGIAGKTEPVEAVDCNLAYLLRDTEEDVQLAALRRLRSLRIHSPEIVELIGRIWLGKARGDALARFAAMEYLAEAGTAALPFAWEGLEGNNPRVRSQAIHLMGRLGPQAVGAALALVDCWYDGDLVNRESILCALGRMKAATQLLPLVAEVWESRDSELVPIAAGLMPLFSIQDRKKLWPLVKNALSCRHRDVQIAAAYSVRCFGKPVFGELAVLAGSADPFDRLGAMLGLKELCKVHSAARSAVENSRVDKDLAVRMAADAAYTTFHGQPSSCNTVV